MAEAWFLAFQSEIVQRPSDDPAMPCARRCDRGRSIYALVTCTDVTEVELVTVQHGRRNFIHVSTIFRANCVSRTVQSLHTSTLYIILDAASGIVHALCLPHSMDTTERKQLWVIHVHILIVTQYISFSMYQGDTLVRYPCGKQYWSFFYLCFQNDNTWF